MLRLFCQRSIKLVNQSQKYISKKKKNINVNTEPEYNPFQALKLVKAHSLTAFDESIDFCVQLGVDPKNGEQIVRGTCKMPYGLGKTTKVAVFVPLHLREEALKAGAEFIGDATLLAKIKEGIIEFDRCFATLDQADILKPYARILGPKGLFPNAKLGTLAKEKDIVALIQDAKTGSVTFRVDSGKNVHTPLGKISFEDNRVLGNLKSFMRAIVDKKPQTSKGTYLNSAFITSTMGPAWRIDVNTIDPRNKSCMI